MRQSRFRAALIGRDKGKVELESGWRSRVRKARLTLLGSPPAGVGRLAVRLLFFTRGLRRRRDDHYRAFRFAKDLVSCAADEQIVEGRVAVRAHYDVVGLLDLSLGQDELGGSAGEEHGLNG